MVLPLIMKTEKNLRALRKICAFEIAAQALDAGGFLNIFFKFWGFEAHFLINIFRIKKNV